MDLGHTIESALIFLKEHGYNHEDVRSHIEARHVKNRPQQERRTRFTVSTSRLDVEHNIRPPFQSAVTLPILIEGKESGGVAIYVAVSTFGALRIISDATLRTIAQDIAIRINKE
jgi:hypothetical protein